MDEPRPSPRWFVWLFGPVPTKGASRLDGLRFVRRIYLRASFPALAVVWAFAVGDGYDQFSLGFLTAVTAMTVLWFLSLNRRIHRARTRPQPPADP